MPHRHPRRPRRLARQPTLPFVPGHEGIGIVEKLGADVTNRHRRRARLHRLAGLGLRRLPLLHRRSRDPLRRQENSGYSVDGAFAEYAVASATYVVPVPDGITSVDAAPLSCAGVTTYKAMKVARVEPTELVGVFGIGGLGHLAVQYARIMGGTVVAIDIQPAKLDLALELGADHVVNARDRRAGCRAPGAWRTGRRRRPGRLASRLRAGLRVAPPRWPTGLCRVARGRRRHEHPDLRDRTQGHLDHRLDRRALARTSRRSSHSTPPARPG